MLPPPAEMKNGQVRPCPYVIGASMTLELICLGTGHGTTHAFEGQPSSSFAVLLDGEPWLLVDCGTGVIRSAWRRSSASSAAGA